MRQATPSARNLARLLLAQEAAGDGYAEPGTDAALRAFEKIRLRLAKLVGVAGFQALLSRALALTRIETVWLDAVRVGADGTLEGLGEAAAQQTAEAAAEGCAALLAELIGLLVTFVGAALTLCLVADAWPELPLNGVNLNENNPGGVNRDAEGIRQ